MFKGYKAKIEVEPDATPQYFKAYTFPYAMRETVEEQLDWLAAEGTLEPVEYSDWAVPTMAVVKRDKKSVRICGHFKVTVNPISKLHRYLTYQQLNLDADWRKYLVIHTYKHLYHYNRDFPESHGNHSEGIPHVTVYIDDILVTEEYHLQTLERVLE